MESKKYMKLIEEYIKSQLEAWSPSTLNSEAARLRAIDAKLLEHPRKLFDTLTQTKGAYTVKTTLIRLADFYEWLREQGHVKNSTNIYKKFLRENARLFKNAYKEERLTITLQEAVDRISAHPDASFRNKAFSLLTGGLRWNESVTYHEGMVQGKGGAQEQVYLPEELVKGPKYEKSYHTFLRELKKMGLKPHTLRKLAATLLAENGADVFDIARFLRHKTINTAIKYVQAQSVKEAGQSIYERITTSKPKI